MEKKGDSWEMSTEELVCYVRVGLDLPMTNFGNASTEMTLLFDNDSIDKS